MNIFRHPLVLVVVLILAGAVLVINNDRRVEERADFEKRALACRATGGEAYRLHNTGEVLCVDPGTVRR